MESKETRIEHRRCVPCAGAGAPLGTDEQEHFFSELDGSGWQIVGGHHLEREYSFPDFQKALNFTNAVGIIAEQENHHPDIYLSYGKVRLEIWTHSVNGLTENDFILAAKIVAARGV